MEHVCKFGSAAMMFPSVMLFPFREDALTTSVPQIEPKIARCRLILSIAALVAMYVDPTEPLLARWISMTSGPFVMDPYLLAVMGAHLTYSLTVYIGLSRQWFSPERVAVQTMWGDVLFGVIIAALTEGVTSPFYSFFAFAVVVVGLRAGLRPAMLVTGVSVALYGLYLCLILLTTGHGANVYIMRPIYLAITGYLVGYLGQQRLELQEEIRRRDAAEQRHRIGRDLHDGFIQALAGMNMRIESCRRSLCKNAVGDALTELTDLRESINREYDALRDYMRTLAGLEVTPLSRDDCAATQLRVHANVSGSVELVDHVLQIVREAIANIRRHAHAEAAEIQIRTAPSGVRISIEDNGVGFPADATPWSISSRVTDVGGELQIVRDHGPGAHLVITLPHHE